jgi:hypothetical protein
LLIDEDIQFNVLQEGEQVETLKRLLGRLCAKIAIEWIGLRCGPRLARDPALDTVRDHARHGTELNGIEVRYAGPPVVWCPKFGQAVMGSPSRLSAEAQRKFLDSIAPSGAPPGVPYLAPPIHTLVCRNTREGGRFGLVLFGCLIVQVPVPESLPLPWSREDSFDLRRKRSTTRWR